MFSLQPNKNILWRKTKTAVMQLLPSWYHDLRSSTGDDEYTFLGERNMANCSWTWVIDWNTKMENFRDLSIKSIGKE
jgi:hypothetical protein